MLNMNQNLFNFSEHFIIDVFDYNNNENYVKKQNEHCCLRLKLISSN